MNTTKSLNTFAAYKRAVTEAFESQAINPAVCYSETRGWFTESMIHPSDPDCMLRIEATYNATNGRRSITTTHSGWFDLCEVFGIKLA